MAAKHRLILACVSLLVPSLSSHNETDSITDSYQFLIKYGYIDSRLAADPPPSPGPVDNRDITEAVRRFQGFVGVEQSGVLDQETLRWMQRPRCGVKDHQPSSSQSPQPFRV